MLAAILITMLAPVQPAAELKPFEFRGFTAGADVDPGRLSKCTARQPGVQDCVEGYIEVGGANSFVMETFVGNRLSSVAITSAQGNWTTIRRAFIAKYGEPCQQELPTWKSASGVSITNIEETWCFTTGKLVLLQYGSKITETMAMYTDEAKTPAPPAKVDF